MVLPLPQIQKNPGLSMEGFFLQKYKKKHKMAFAYPFVKYMTIAGRVFVDKFELKTFIKF